MTSKIIDSIRSGKNTEKSERRNVMTKDVFDEMASKWPSAVVARTEIAKFSGGLISAKYLANLDSLRQGPERIQCGRKIAYPVTTLVAWMRKRRSLNSSPYRKILACERHTSTRTFHPV